MSFFNTKTKLFHSRETEAIVYVISIINMLSLILPHF